MTLQYKKTSPTIIEIEDQLKALSLAYKIEQYETLTLPKLLDSGQEIVGKEAILKHLAILEGELHSWYYCDC